MERSILPLVLEGGLFGGAALAWCAYELWSLKKSNSDQPDDAKEDATPESEDAAGHTER